MTAQVTNTFVVEIDGTRVPAELDIAAVTVEDHLHLPDAFAVTFRDGSRLALTDCRAKIGGKVKISVLNDSSPKPRTLIEGEVTALEAEIHQGTSYTVVRG